MEPLSMLDGAFGNAGVEQERVGLDFDFIWGFCFKQLKGVLQFTRSAEFSVLEDTNWVSSLQKEDTCSHFPDHLTPFYQEEAGESTVR
ncbi:hypothetical protein AAC387_Pa11g1247 [Persea americana]